MKKRLNNMRYQRPSMGLVAMSVFAYSFFYSTAAWSSSAAKLSSTLEQYYQSARSYLREAEVNASDLSPADKARVKSYFQDTVRIQYGNVLSQYSLSLNQALSTYKKNIQSAIESVSNKEKFEACYKTEFGSTFRAGWKLDVDKFSKKFSELSTVISAANRREMEDRSVDWGRIEADVISPDFASAVSTCCLSNGGNDKSCQVELNLPRLLSPPDLTNPFEELSGKMDQEDVLALMKSSGFMSDYKKALNKSSIDGDDHLSSLFSDIDRACENKKQKKAKIFETSTVANMARVFRCQVMPFVTTMYLDSEWQKLSLGLGAAPIQGKDKRGEEWNANCDPTELALWDSLRPSDPNVVIQKWGLDRISNPVWINNLRMLAPVNSNVPFVTLPNGTVLTSYGPINLGPNTPTTLAGNGFVNTGGGTTGGSTTTRGSGTSRFAGSTRSLASMTASSTGRGLADSSAARLGIRSLSANIAAGRSASQSASALRSGASSVRGLATSVAATGRNMGAAVLRSTRSAQASNARGLVGGISAASATRTSTETLLGNVQGRGGVTIPPATGTSSGIGNLGNLQQQMLYNQQEQERRRRALEAYMRTLDADTSAAKTRANEALDKIREMINQRDSKVNTVINDIMRKPPYKQEKMVRQLQMELLNMDKELGALKREYDINAAAVAAKARQAELIAQFGPDAPGVLSGVGGAPRNNSTTPSRFLNPEQTFLDRVLPKSFLDQLIAKAYASSGPGLTGTLLGKFKTQKAWLEGYDQFVVDMEKRLQEDRQAEKAAKKKLAEGLGARMNLLKDQWVSYNTETLEVMQSFAEAIREESEDLMKSTRVPGAQPKFTAQVGDVLDSAAKDAKSALDAIEEIRLQYRDAYPKSYEDNDEVWWGIAGEALLN